MPDNFCLAVNGLDEPLFGNPLAQLADFLNAHTPEGVHFNVVGGLDPRPFINQFIHNCEVAAGAGQRLILVGHSLGAMMMFYLADAMKARGITVPLLVPIDATDWGTNAPGIPPYSMGTSTPGEYWCPDNVGHCVYFHQPVYPGGGIARLAAGNTTTKFDDYPRAEAHVVLPILPVVQQIILTAVLEATS